MSDLTFSRRNFVAMLAALPVVAGVCAARVSADSSKVSKAAMHYQTSPNGGMQCSGCRFFTPGTDAKADGSCQIVEGAISPSGYCMAYAAK